MMRSSRQPRQCRGFTGRLALVLVEEGGNRDHGSTHRLSECAAGPIPQFAENHGADLRRRELLIAQRDRLHAPHPAFDRRHRAIGKGGQLIFRGHPRDQLSLRIDPDDRRQQGLSCFVEHARLTVDDHGHHAVGGSQIDPDDGTLAVPSCVFSSWTL